MKKYVILILILISAPLFGVAKQALDKKTKEDVHRLLQEAIDQHKEGNDIQARKSYKEAMAIAKDVIPKDQMYTELNQYATTLSGTPFVDCDGWPCDDGCACLGCKWNYGAPPCGPNYPDQNQSGCKCVGAW